jgi:hypothetical protein
MFLAKIFRRPKSHVRLIGTVVLSKIVETVDLSKIVETVFASAQSPY